MTLLMLVSPLLVLINDETVAIVDILNVVDTVDSIDAVDTVFRVDIVYIVNNVETVPVGVPQLFQMKI